MPKFNFELLRTFILNFCCIHSKRRKKYTCTRYLKRQLIYPNKVNSLLIRYFIHFQCHVTIFSYNILEAEDLKIYHLTAAPCYLNTWKRLLK